MFRGTKTISHSNDITRSYEHKHFPVVKGETAMNSEKNREKIDARCPEKSVVQGLSISDLFDNAIEESHGNTKTSRLQ